MMVLSQKCRGLLPWVESSTIWSGQSERRLQSFINSLLQLQRRIFPPWSKGEKMPARWYLVWRSTPVPPNKEYVICMQCVLSSMKICMLIFKHISLPWQKTAQNFLHCGMERSLWTAMVPLQQPTTAATMGMSWMVHTPGNASTTVVGMERLQNAVG